GVRLPLDDLLDVGRAVCVRDLDPGADNLRGAGLEHGRLDAWKRAVPGELGPLRQVENLPGDVGRGEAQRLPAGEGDRPHEAAFRRAPRSAPTMAGRFLVTFSAGQSHHRIVSSSATTSSGNRSLTTLAGFPPTTEYGGTSLVTTDRAATMDPSPI